MAEDGGWASARVGESTTITAVDGDDGGRRVTTTGGLKSRRSSSPAANLKLKRNLAMFKIFKIFLVQK